MRRRVDRNVARGDAPWPRAYPRIAVSRRGRRRGPCPARVRSARRRRPVSPRPGAERAALRWGRPRAKPCRLYLRACPCRDPSPCLCPWPAWPRWSSARASSKPAAGHSARASWPRAPASPVPALRVRIGLRPRDADGSEAPERCPEPRWQGRQRAGSLTAGLNAPQLAAGPAAASPQRAPERARSAEEMTAELSVRGPRHAPTRRVPA